MGSWDIKRYLDILLEKFLSACVTAIVIMGVDCGDENNQSKPVPGLHVGGDWTLPQVAALQLIMPSANHGDSDRWPLGWG